MMTYQIDRDFLIRDQKNGDKKLIKNELKHLNIPIIV